MLTIKGCIENGTIHPSEQIEQYKGEVVTITIDRASEAPPTVLETGWDALTKLIDDCQVDTGTTDLAHQHDHYLYGAPKRED